ncbi:17353_t:CDS:2 [Acaulospora colombiana]|uniref:17353_t:CDS:1 n=1 Tax=Acaulospora colombiana TaxID=27376 RepID=A0ACA9KGW6_9GLOM|nr:17353_t:CDS:2 [Acaulospora colombiana]
MDSMDVTYNVSGENGNDGVNGTSYYNASTHYGPGHIHIEGSLNHPFGHRELINEDVFLGMDGLINLFAQGGRGGNGANGGRGQDGAKGLDGTDATKYSRGTDGGSGCNGGHAGSGSSGADGGSGGTISVTVSEEDSYLLHLLGTHNVEGGVGGSPGRNGQRKELNILKRDYQGNTRQISRTQAGGIDGANGRDGFSSNAQPTTGKQGMRGNFSFGIIINGSVITYNDLFKLEIIDFKYETQDASGIIEPSGRVIIHSMRFRNYGTMPTPRHKDIRISLRPFNNIVANSTQVNAPRHILSGKTAISRDPLHIRIDDINTVSDGSPLQQSVDVGFMATMTGIERPLQLLLKNQLHFTVQYPINIGEVIAIHVPGDKYTYEIFCSVTNVGRCDLGRQSNCGRHVRAALNKGEMVDNQRPLELEEINLLHAGESKQLRYRVQLDNTLGNDQQQHFSVTLQIGKMDQQDLLKSIQRRKFLLRPARYKENDLLLCTFHNACTNIPNDQQINAEYRGVIDIKLSNPINATNLGEVKISGTIKYSSGCKIELDHNFSFRTDGHIYISTGYQGGDVTITVAEHESHLLLLLAHNFDNNNNSRTRWKFKVVNETHNRIEEYDKPFKLEVYDFIVRSDVLEDVHEPGGKASIRNIKLRNLSRMPTPGNHEIRISLSSSDWIVPDDISLTLPKLLPFGDVELTTQRPFEFSLRDDVEINHIPLKIHDRIQFSAIMTAGNRLLPSFSIAQPILIQHPIEINKFVGFRYPGRDETFGVFWCVENNSRMKFGRKTELSRAIEISLSKITSDADDCTIFFKKDLTFTSNEIKNMRTKVTLEKKGDGYVSTKFESHLRSGTPEFPETPSTIQLHRFQLSPFTSHTYSPFDLILNLGEGRLTENGNQPGDHSQNGEIHIFMHAPNRAKNKPGDLSIRGTLKYTNGWKTEFDDWFSLGRVGLVHLIPNGNNDLTSGTINVECPVEETHLFYLIHEATLTKCRNVQLQVQSGQWLKRYRRLYKLELVDFECEPEDQSSVYEPGAKAFISKIVVKNTGEMPTPSGKDILVFIISSHGIIPTGEIILPKSIGDSCEETLNLKRNNDDMLCFNIKRECKPSYERTFSATYNINLRANMTGIERPITSFTKLKNLEIKYPIRICSKTGIQDFANNDETRVIWMLDNISRIPFGAKSKLRRIVKVGVSLTEVEPPDSLKFLRDDDSKDLENTPVNYHEQEVILLEANRAVLMVCTLVPNKNKLVSDDDDGLPQLIKARLLITLKLGSIEDPTRANDIEIRKHEMVISPKYEPNKKAEVLMVINRDTRIEEYDAWSRLFRELNLRGSTWDLSRMGHFDLFSPYSGSASCESTEFTDSTIVDDDRQPSIHEDGAFLETAGKENSRLIQRERGSSDTLSNEGNAVTTSFLAADFREKTIVILNNLFKDISNIHDLKVKKNVFSRALDYLDPSQMLQAFRGYGVKFYIVGTEIDDKTLRGYFIPRNVISSSIIMPDPTIRRYIQYKENFELDCSQMNGSIENEQIECVETYLRPMFHFMSSEESYVKQKICRISKSLQTLYPERRHLIITKQGKDRGDDRVFICRTVDRTQRHLGHINMNDDDIHIPETVNSNENTIGLLSCIPFARRLEKLKELTSESIQNKKVDFRLLKSLQKLLEVDLTMELVGLCRIREIKNLPVKPLSVSNAKFLEKFCDFFVYVFAETKSAENYHSQWILDVMVNLKVMLDCGKKWTDILKPNTILRSQILGQILQEEYRKAFEKISEGVPGIISQSQNHVLAQKKRREQELNLGQNESKDDKFHFAINQMLGFLNDINVLKNDWNILDEDMEIVITDEEYQALENDYEKRASMIHERITAFEIFNSNLTKQIPMTFDV